MILILYSIITFSTEAKVYTFNGNPNLVAVALKNPYDDFALRIEAIKKAKYSIDIGTYVQTLDPHLGEEYLQAIEDAIHRGVQVRFIMEWLPNTASLGVHAGEPAKRLLRAAFHSDRCKLQVQCVNPYSKILAGFTPTDSFHEKPLNIDAGTEHEISWVSGRNNNENVMRDLDFAVVMRRKDPHQPSALSLLHQVYEDNWQEALYMQKPEESLSNLAIERQKIEEPISHHVTSQYDSIKRCLFGNEEISGLSFRPESMVVTTNHFFQQLRQNSWLTVSRQDKMQSDNITSVSESIEKSKTIRMSIMSTFWPKMIKKALMKAVQRGAKIEIFTNSEESDRTAVPGALSYLYSSRDLMELRKWVDLHPKSELIINVLNLTKKNEFTEYWKRIHFVHQKMILTDQAIHFGSDNYNVSSSLKNSEMQVILTGKETVSFFNSHFDEITALFTPLNCEALLVANQKSRGMINHVLIRMLRPFL